MIDYEVQRFTRRCAATDRELRPGDYFYSVLVPRGADVVRLDYSEEGWSGPPEDSLGWWKSQVPDPKSQQVKWAPHEIMLHYFQQLSQTPEKRDLAYVLALLMVRRRIFRLEASEKSTDGQETLIVYCRRDENEYRVPVVTPDADRAAQLQQELVEMLFGDDEESTDEDKGV